MSIVLFARRAIRQHHRRLIDRNEGLLRTTIAVLIGMRHARLFAESALDIALARLLQLQGRDGDVEGDLARWYLDVPIANAQHGVQVLIRLRLEDATHHLGVLLLLLQRLLLLFVVHLLEIGLELLLAGRRQSIGLFLRFHFFWCLGFATLLWWIRAHWLRIFEWIIVVGILRLLQNLPHVVSVWILLCGRDGHEEAAHEHHETDPR
mmetsp:Transcript_12892/g.35609  ORF Transcript_12892/g.35609 Transcript_12892/m.35609 type:complete len:207 (-) Transcript_12892:183-803(-)